MMARTPRTSRGRSFGESRSKFKAGNLGNACGGTLGSLLRTALGQVGSMRDVVEREARATRSRLDGALGDRRRQDALARLGDAVFELWVRGELGDLDEIPELRGCLAEIEAIDARAEVASRERGGPARSADDRGGEPAARDEHEAEDDGAVSSANWAASRARFDRGRPVSTTENLRVWRPVAPRDPPARRDTPPRGTDGGSRDHGQARAPEPARDPESIARAERPTRPSRAAVRPGGIAFVPDEPDEADELAEYMHSDDVPPRGK